MGDRFLLKSNLLIWKNNLDASIKHKKCVFVIGPTASGKSAIAIEWANKYKGSILNIDSIQLYKGLIIGSAAPTEKEKLLAPHHLYNYVEAPDEMTAGQYVRDFYKLLEDPLLKFPLFIVGGTGFYIQALEKGMFDIEEVPKLLRIQIENELKEKGDQALYKELVSFDPSTKIHKNDHFRLIRALEIIRFTGKTPSEYLREQRNKNPLPYEYIKIGIDFEKKQYQERVHKRTKQMIDQGLLEETKHFLNRGFLNWSPLRSVGYKESVLCLNNELKISNLTEAIQQSTMQLIKKQKTWFKRDGAILWSNESELQALGLREKLDRFLT